LGSARIDDRRGEGAKKRKRKKKCLETSKQRGRKVMEKNTETGWAK